MRCDRDPRPAGQRRATRLVAGRRLFGRYRLERSLGHGASGEVWQARDERLDRTVAVKVLRPRDLADGASADGVIAEARAAAGLTHPAIVPVFDVVDDARTPAIVFRFIDGESLAERLARRGALPAAEAAAIAADLASAIGHAHRAGLVHRDVKPGNVLVDREGRAQLVDFGIARARDGGTAPAQQRSIEVRGTLRYMAPEQLTGGPVDARTDLYALGLVLHELLAGQPAYAATSAAELAAAHRRGPSVLPGSIPRPLSDLVGELLAVDPARRPAAADAVVRRLRAFLASLPPETAAPTTGMDEVAIRSRETETVAFVPPPTVAIRAALPPTPAAAALRSGRVRAGSWRRRLGRDGVATGGAIVMLAAVVLALAIGGLGSAPAAVTVPLPSAASASATPALPATPSTVTKGVKPGRDGGKGHGGRGGGD